MPRRVQRGGGGWSTAAKAVAKTAGIGALSALVNRSMRRSRKPKPPKRTIVRTTARRGQAGGAFPLLAAIPVLAAAGKAIATGALSGAAGYAAQRALKKLNKRKKRSRR